MKLKYFGLTTVAIVRIVSKLGIERSFFIPHENSFHDQFPLKIVYFSMKNILREHE